MTYTHLRDILGWGRSTPKQPENAFYWSILRYLSRYWPSAVPLVESVGPLDRAPEAADNDLVPPVVSVWLHAPRPFTIGAADHRSAASLGPKADTAVCLGQECSEW